MNSTKASFTKGFEKTADLKVRKVNDATYAKIFHETQHKSPHGSNIVMGDPKGDELKKLKKMAALPSWLHEAGGAQSKVPGQSKLGIKGLMKRRGLVVGGVLG